MNWKMHGETLKYIFRTFKVCLIYFPTCQMPRHVPKEWNFRHKCSLRNLIIFEASSLLLHTNINTHIHIVSNGQLFTQVLQDRTTSVIRVQQPNKLVTVQHHRRLNLYHHRSETLKSDFIELGLRFISTLCCSEGKHKHSKKVEKIVDPIRGYEGPDGEQRYSSTLSLTWRLDCCGWSRQGPGRFTPWKETRHPLYRKMWRSQGRSKRARKTSPLPGFDPLTIPSSR